METEAQAAAQRNRAPNGYHRGCAHWVIEPGVLEPHAPEAARLELMNLRAFAAAPDRLEHFLEPVARIDIALISVDARTSWPDGSVPIRSRDPASSTGRSHSRSRIANRIPRRGHADGCTPGDRPCS